MKAEDLILGGNARLGGEIWANTCLAPGYLTDDELAIFSFVTLHRRHLQHLDLTRPSVVPVGVPESWPIVQVRPVENMLHDLRVIKDPETGIQYPAGTTEFSLRRTLVEGKGHKKKQTWTASAEELRRQEEAVKSFNTADLQINQEEVGIRSKRLQVFLRYHDLTSALAVLRDGPYRHLLFEAGRERPDHTHLIMLLSAEGDKAIYYQPFVLQIL